MRHGFSLLPAAVLLLTGPWTAPGGAQGPAGIGVAQPLQHAISPPLDRLLPIPPTPEAFSSIPLRPAHGPRAPRPAAPDPVLQSPSSGTLSGTIAGQNFTGLGYGLPGFTVQYIPPDTNGAVGPTEYVQWVNASFAVFDKTNGKLLRGPYAGNTLWQALGGPCARNNSGDPIAQYDKLAGRWVMMQPVFKSPYYLCVAVSSGSSFVDSSWALYALGIPNKLFPDYPKLTVWPDGYYITYNQFQGQAFAGPAVCALDRANMLAGLAATAQCQFDMGTSYGSMLSADFDGTTSTLPPAGSPEYLVSLGGDGASLDFWKFKVDWVNSVNTGLTRSSIPVAPFSEACGGGACIQQSGTTQVLDSLGDRVMYRLAYRNLGDHESLLLNHSVATGTGNVAGIRWYELQTSGPLPVGCLSNPCIIQQSTYAPDLGTANSSRWMGSIAMDSAGNIALGYSVSSSSISPSIRYTGRKAGDTLGQMGGKNDLLGNLSRGSQTSYNRWGDYSSMLIDPTDDCTFWFTTEYQHANGNAWSTRFASFKFDNCGTALSPDFSISASPASRTVNAGSGTSYTISASSLNNFNSTVTLSASVSPNEPSITLGFTPGNTISGGSGSENLTVSTSSSTPAGTYTITITGIGGGLSHDTQVTLVVNSSGGGGGGTGSFSLSASPGNVTLKGGGTASYTVTLSSSGGFNGDVSLTASGQPSGAAVAFTPNPVVGGSGTSTFTVTSSAIGSYSITIKGTSGSLTATTSVRLKIM